MINTLMCLGRSLVCLACYRSTIGMAVLMFCCCLPFVLFGSFEYDGVVVESVSIFHWVSFDSANSPRQALVYHPYSYDDLYSLQISSVFGFKVRNAAANKSPVRPSSSFFSSSQSTSYLTLDNSILATTNGVHCGVSPLYFPNLSEVYLSCCALFANGYRGPGFPQIFSDSTFSCVNVDYPVLLSDVLSSTNTLFRQILLSHLSSIQTSVQNIELNVSGLQSSIDEGNNILSNISQNTTSAISTLSDISQSSSASSVLLSQVSSNTSAFVSALSQVSSNTLSSASSLSQVSSNTAASVSALSDISSNTRASADTLSDISSSAASSYQVLSSISSEAGSANGHLNSLDSLMLKYTPFLAASLGGSATPSPDNPFFPYDPNNTNDPNHPLNPNSPWNPNSPNFLGGGGGLGAFTTNQVLRPLTNTVRQASADIQSNATSNADRQIDKANDIWDEFKERAFDDGEGLNVRVKFPLWESDSYHLNVRDDAVVEAIQNLHPVSTDIANIRDILEHWYTDSDFGKVEFPSNLLDQLDAILDAITNRPSYMLLDDYAFYISNGVYSSAVGQFQVDFPFVYTNLQKYGFSPDSNGNFWSLFGANLLYQSGLIGSLLDDMALVRNFADEHIEGGFSEGVKKIVDSFPSPSQLEDFLSSASNQLSQIESSTNDLLAAFSSLTNATSSVFDPFKGEFDSPPDGLVFFKTGNEQYVTIPVSDQMSVWATLRLGFSFGLVAVNLLLFPKFILLLVKLFARLYSRFVKFVPEQ